MGSALKAGRIWKSGGREVVIESDKGPGADESKVWGKGVVKGQDGEGIVT